MDTKVDILKRHQNPRIKERTRSRLCNLYIMCLLLQYSYRYASIYKIIVPIIFERGVSSACFCQIFTRNWKERAQLDIFSVFRVRLRQRNDFSVQADVHEMAIIRKVLCKQHRKNIEVLKRFMACLRTYWYLC